MERGDPAGTGPASEALAAEVEKFRRQGRALTRDSLTLSLLIALLIYFWREEAAKGLVLGSLAGVLALQLSLREISRRPFATPSALARNARIALMARWAIRLGVLIATALIPFADLLAAAGGLFIPNLMIILRNKANTA